MSKLLGRAVRLISRRGPGATVELPDPGQMLDLGLDTEVAGMVLEIGKATPGTTGRLLTEAIAMADPATDLARPRGRYGVDGDYRLIPAPVVLAGYLLLCVAAAVLAAMWLTNGRLAAGTGAAVVAVVLIGAGVGIRRFSLRGKFEVWAHLLTGLGLRGDERVLDLGCGRGAVLLAVAKLLPRGSAVGVDIWRPDQTGNHVEATLANAEAEGVADRIELHTRDMTDLQFPDASFDLVVSSLAIHNLPGNKARLAAIDGAVRVLRPGGRLVITDIGFTRLYATRLRQRGMANVERHDLGWRGWWGLPFIRTHAVTATKPDVLAGER